MHAASYFGAPIEELRFASDSPLEETVKSEPVSRARFPVEDETVPLGRAPLMTSRDVIEYVIRSAEHCESLVARSRRLRVHSGRLIKIRPA
jgi:hypothetical protein